MSPARVWLVTGSSTGIGRTMVELALKKGDKVVATLRRPEQLADLRSRYSTTQLLVLKLDVTQPSEILLAFTRAKGVFGPIDVVFNNAGMGATGEIEGTPDDIARRLFETNFFGAANVTREAVRFFREEKAPGVGGSATKHALEAVTQAIAEEIDPEWNIRITLIEPGHFRTPGLNSDLLRPKRLPAYSKPTTPAAQVWNAFEASLAPDFKGGDVNKAVARIYEISELSQPPLRIVLGQDAIDTVKSQLKLLQKDVAASEAWSQDLKEY